MSAHVQWRGNTRIRTHRSKQRTHLHDSGTHCTRTQGRRRAARNCGEEAHRLGFHPRERCHDQILLGDRDLHLAALHRRRSSATAVDHAFAEAKSIRHDCVDEVNLSVQELQRQLNRGVLSVGHDHAPIQANYWQQGVHIAQHGRRSSVYIEICRRRSVLAPTVDLNPAHVHLE